MHSRRSSVENAGSAARGSMEFGGSCSGEDEEICDLTSTANQAKPDKKKKLMRFADQEDMSNANNFKLLPAWTGEEQPRTLVHAATTRRNLEGSGLDDDTDSEDELAHDNTCPGHCLFQKFVIKASSNFAEVWSSIGYIAVCYDCVFLPLEFLDLDSSTSVQVMGWMVRIYWSLHIPKSMFTAHEQLNGHTDRRVGKVVMKYIHGMFLWDLLLAALDWIAILPSHTDLALFRLLRMLRLTRLLQVRMMPLFLKRVVHANAASSTVYTVSKNVLMIFWFNHLTGCIWYSIGVNGNAGENWLDVAAEKGRNVASLDFIYLEAYRWQLANFVGESGIHPQTIPEFLYLILTSIMAFVSACVCVSSITSAMTRLEIAVAHDAQRFSLLRQFLTEHKISIKLASRITQNAQFQAAQLKKKTPEHEIALLGVVSEPLRIDLHYEINMQIFGGHPFFQVYSILSERVMRQICHKAVNNLHMARGDVLFRAEEIAITPQMYFIIEGKIAYNHQSGEFKPWIKGGWACEPCLWVSWIHYGTARARCECDLALLSAEAFQKHAMADIEDNKNFLLKYGALMIQGLNDTPPLRLTDLADPELDYSWIAARAIPDHIDKNLRKKIDGSVKSTKARGHSATKNTSTLGHILQGLSGHARSSTGSSGSGHCRSNLRKLDLATNIVDSQGPSRRTRIAGQELAKDAENLRSSFQSVLSSDSAATAGHAPPTRRGNDGADTERLAEEEEEDASQRKRADKGGREASIVLVNAPDEDLC